MVFITNYVIYFSLLLSLFLGIRGGIKEKKALLILLPALLICILLIKFIHLFIHEPRPFITFNFTPLADNNPDLSFPSRHATIMAVVAFSYTYFKSKWAYLFLPLMVLVGLSRIFVGVHYPLDILGGFLVGVMAIVISLKIAKYLQAKFFF